VSSVYGDSSLIDCKNLNMCVYKQFTVYAVYIVGWVRGVTQLGNIVYIVCNKSPTIDVYSADTLSPLGEGE